MTKLRNKTGRLYIQKAKVTSQFTTIPNALAQNKDLSWRARGLLVYLLSLPENWRIRKSELGQNKRHSTDGRDSTWRAFEELEKRGYIRTEKMPGTQNSPPQNAYFVHCIPLLKIRSGEIGSTVDGSTVDGSTVDGSTVEAKSAATKNPLTKKTVTKETPTKRGACVFDEIEILIFEEARKLFAFDADSADAILFEKFILGAGAESNFLLQRLLDFIAYKEASGESFGGVRTFVGSEMSDFRDGTWKVDYSKKRARGVGPINVLKKNVVIGCELVQEGKDYGVKQGFQGLRQGIVR